MIDRLTPLKVATITQRVATTYPTNTEEYLALAISAGVLMGLHMGGGLTDILLQDGTFPIPSTIADAMEHGESSVDPTILHTDYDPKNHD